MVEPISSGVSNFTKCIQIPENIINRALNPQKRPKLRSQVQFGEDPTIRMHTKVYSLDTWHYGQTGIVKESPNIEPSKIQRALTGAPVDPLAVMAQRNKHNITAQKMMESQQDAYDNRGYDPSTDLRYIQENACEIAGMPSTPRPSKYKSSPLKKGAKNNFNYTIQEEPESPYTTPRNSIGTSTPIKQEFENPIILKSPPQRHDTGMTEFKPSPSVSPSKPTIPEGFEEVEKNGKKLLRRKKSSRNIPQAPGTITSLKQLGKGIY